MAKYQKCEFGKSCVTYLGHVVQNGTMYAHPYKVAAIKIWPKLTNDKEVQQFVG